MANRETKRIRNMKVLEQSGYKYKPTPAIMLKGKWLAEFGFDIATPVQVQCEEGRLVITKAVQYPEAETEQMKVAEKKGSYGKGTERGNHDERK